MSTYKFVENKGDRIVWNNVWLFKWTSDAIRYYENLMAEHGANQFFGMMQTDFSSCLRIVTYACNFKDNTQCSN